MVFEWQTMERKFNRCKMRTITTKVYKIYEHPNREKCYEWIRENWHDLNEHSVHDVVESINALTKIIGGSNDCSIYSDEGLFELCELNEYEFNEEGNIH